MSWVLARLELRKLALALAVAVPVGCVHAAKSETPVQSYAHGTRPSNLGKGWASFYGAELRGNRTASGERFDPAALTAAHRTLPLGSCVAVQSARTGRTVEVRINDRGPFAHHRVIDVSLAAAKQLGVVGDGVFRVILHPCS